MGLEHLSGMVPCLSRIDELHWQFAEKAIFLRLLKNAQMQGARNPEE
jgi:hypothetical protein